MMAGTQHGCRQQEPAEGGAEGLDGFIRELCPGGVG